jgi:hypothetical protein
MTEWMYFVHKFKNSVVFLPISHVERIKEVFSESGGRINIHCETTESEPYLFTICVEYAKVHSIFPFPQELRGLKV